MKKFAQYVEEAFNTPVPIDKVKKADYGENQYFTVGGKKYVIHFMPNGIKSYEFSFGVEDKDEYGAFVEYAATNDRNHNQVFSTVLQAMKEKLDNGFKIDFEGIGKIGKVYIAMANRLGKQYSVKHSQIERNSLNFEVVKK